MKEGKGERQKAKGESRKAKVGMFDIFLKTNVRAFYFCSPAMLSGLVTRTCAIKVKAESESRNRGGGCLKGKRARTNIFFYLGSILSDEFSFTDNGKAKVNG